MPPGSGCSILDSFPTTGPARLAPLDAQRPPPDAMIPKIRWSLLAAAAVLLGALAAPAAAATPDCTALAEAREHYMYGRFDQGIALLEACIADGDLTREQQMAAYPLLVETYLAKQAEAEAIAATKRLLELVPHYEPPDKPTQFRYLVHRLKETMQQEDEAAPPVDLPDFAAANPEDFARIDPPFPLVYIDVEEVNGGSEVAVSRIRPALKRALLLEGYALLRAPRSADYYIEVRAVTREGVEYRGRHTAFADLRLAVIDYPTGVELYEATVTNARGAHVNRESAGLAALEAAAQTLQTDHLEEMLAHMQTAEAHQE